MQEAFFASCLSLKRGGVSGANGFRAPASGDLSLAALEDVNFECQRLEIVNKNLDFQLKEANRELRQNIAVLEALESENRALRARLQEQE